MRQKGVEVVVIQPGEAGIFDLEAFEEAITDDTKLVAISHASNVLGTVQPVREISKICKAEGAYFLDERAAALVRSGDRCCIPLMKHLGLENGTVRASLYL